MFTNNESKIYVWDATNERWEVRNKYSGVVLFYVWETPDAYIWSTSPTPTEEERHEIRGKMIWVVVSNILNSELEGSKAIS